MMWRLCGRMGEGVEKSVVRVVTKGAQRLYQTTLSS